MILDEMLEELSFELKRRKVINLCVGPSYTTAILDDQSMGISITHTDGEVEEAGELQGKSAYEVARNLDTPMRRSVSLAVMNALSPPQLSPGDPLQHFQGGKLCVFGYSPQVSYEGFSEVVAYSNSMFSYECSESWKKKSTSILSVGSISFERPINSVHLSLSSSGTIHPDPSVVGVYTGSTVPLAYR